MFILTMANRSIKHLRKLIARIIKASYRASIFGLETGAHVTRYYMYNHLSQYYEPRPDKQKILSISHSQGLAKILGFKDEQILNIGFPEANLLALPYESETFDAIVSDQVLEHIEGNPFDAIEESFRVLKPGGLALHTS